MTSHGVEVVSDREVAAVNRLLTEAEAWNCRAKAALPEHARSFYRRKDEALGRALVRGAKQFVIDSVKQESPLILGITHKYTGREFHVRPGSLLPEAKEALRTLPPVRPPSLRCRQSERRRT